MEYSAGSIPTIEELIVLYDSVGWSAYTADPDQLLRGVTNSSYVVTARADDGRLVGLARVLSDDVTIMYLQDVLVDPAMQRRRIGRTLIERCIDRYAHVRQRVLLTDDEPHTHRLYETLGFHDVVGLADHGLHAFVHIQGAAFLTDDR